MRRLEAVIFDWAGTMVDFGSLAPVRAITELFSNEGIEVSDSDARRDMGIFKKDHIRKLLGLPHIEAQWIGHAGKPPVEADVENLFAQFIPLQLEILETYSGLIPGAAETANRLKSRGLKIGSTTGYTRPMLDVLLAAAGQQGYQPDLAYCPDDVGAGRPLPWMCLRIALEFRLSSTAAAVKIGDTVSDIEEGRNAGAWTVGVAATGNEVGMSAAGFASLPQEERARRLETARESLRAAGPHYVIDSVADIDPVLEQIGARLQAGERP
jgi:phosphonoacetaldehyde hydrolase